MVREWRVVCGGCGLWVKGGLWGVVREWRVVCGGCGLWVKGGLWGVCLWEWFVGGVFVGMVCGGCVCGRVL